jgi:tetratricopeptide (TPR) repeat protein
MKLSYKTIALLSSMIILISACKKDFLDAKPSTTIVAPSTLADLQLLLENSDVLNSCSPGLPFLGGDEYIFLDYPTWQSATVIERNSYIWAKDIYAGETGVRDWNNGYSAIFYCNNVLETLNQIDKLSDIKLYNTVKGWALFVRANALFDLTSCFSPAYDPNTASSDLGLPVRLKPGIDEILPRSNVNDTYNQIIADLNEAKSLLEPSLPINRNRPSKPAAYALLSRVYLSMREYYSAEAYADSTLSLYNKLIDYNTISKTSTNPFPINNDETIFNSATIGSAYQAILPSSVNTRVVVNPALMDLYNLNDLRLIIFFKKSTTTGNMYFNRNYAPLVRAFTGLATDEIYLIKAECLARRNQLSQAAVWVNSLLIKRFPPANYKPIAVPETNAQLSLLNQILMERRKELVWRALRWADLKRLNKDGANITLTRTLNNQTYTLPPNDPRYVFPIPDDEVNSSGIQQNIR